MKRHASGMLAVAGIAIVTACQSHGNKSSAGQTTAAATTAVRPDTSEGVAGMPGMSAGMSGTMMMDSNMTKMMDSMRTEMTRMDAMTPDQMRSTMATHRQMAGNVLAQMNSEMRSMNMAADPAWTALVDSVRRDLVRMPSLSGEQLKTFMTAHHERMDRLMAMHRDMMSKVSGAKK